MTPTEWRVAEGVRHGLTNGEIAKRQSVSMDAVKFHVSNILGKLGFSSRKELRLWEGIEEGSALENEHSSPCIQAGLIGQIGRSVANIGDAQSWYRDVLGLAHLFSSGGMAFFDCSGTRLMLTEGKAEHESILYFITSDIHQKHRDLKEKGATILSAPHRIHTHEDGTEEWMCFFEDCDGRPLAFMATAQPESEDS